ncbi:MAG: helix-turn-helix transcriptional regulator [Candidatus Thiodiazotropha sp. (ex Epidulcina cf. delphinae)]|nr:helix-turn-helix transcriptional regulator [Candidatus Thiodiazotropha sp. (ex Epidulcina cf. delphinae)]
MFESDDLNAAIEFISMCQKIENPRLDDICLLLRHLHEFQSQNWALGLCRVNKPNAELLKTVHISADCLQQQEGCSSPEPCSCCTGDQAEWKERVSVMSFSCKPKRFASMETIEGGFVFCQTSRLGRDFASCLFLEDRLEVLSEMKKVLELIIPHLLHLIEDLQDVGFILSQLTEREKEVLRWIGEGKSNWEIGRILDITERTAKYHISNILTKLNLVNRVQAAVFASLLPRPH